MHHVLEGLSPESQIGVDELPLCGRFGLDRRYKLTDCTGVNHLIVLVVSAVGSVLVLFQELVDRSSMATRCSLDCSLEPQSEKNLWASSRLCVCHEHHIRLELASQDRGVDVVLEVVLESTIGEPAGCFCLDVVKGSELHSLNRRKR